MGRLVATLAMGLVAACGRFGFDETVPASDAASDGAADATAATCDRLFCDDFAGGLAAWDGTIVEGSSTAVFDTMFGRAGGSLHATAPAGTAIAAVYKDVFAAMPAELHVRSYIFAPSGQLLDLEPVGVTNVGRNYQIVFSIYDTDIDIHAHQIAGDFNESIAIATPRDRWVCFELHVAIGTTGSVRLDMDGTQIVASGSLDTRPPNGDLRRLLVGVTSKPGPGSSHVFVDDVVADTAPVGCD